MEGTYEYELERAELLGVDPLSREEWEIQNRARLQAQLEQQQICDEKAQEIQAEAEQIQGGHGKMDELNSILNATQMKLNKFKVRMIFPEIFTIHESVTFESNIDFFSFNCKQTCECRRFVVALRVF